MRPSPESFLNETDESDIQNAKHREERILTPRGIMIDSRAEE
jgi:hypothetical protein